MTMGLYAGRALLLGPLLAWGCSPAPEPAPGSGAVADPAAELVPLGSRPRGDEPGLLGLSGANKPNGIQYRLRRSVPQSTPRFVPRSLDGLSLWIADPVPEGWFAFYRGPLELQPGSRNAEFRAVLFDSSGARLWDLPLNPLLSRPTHLEIQDIRLHRGKLYLNEACQSYSREAGGQCSSLARIDPRRAAVEWRTRPLVSNDIFILHDGVVVAGYGFTAEPDSLFLVAQESGEILARTGLDSAHSYLEVVDGRLVVLTRNRVYEFGLR